MSTAFTLTRRSLILAGAAWGLAALLPRHALAQAANASAEPSQGFDPAGTWVLVATACDDEEVAESLGLIAALSTTVYDLRADGTLTCTMTPLIENAEDDGQAGADDPSSNSPTASAGAAEPTEDAEATAVDDLDKALTETVSEEGTWEVTGSEEVTLCTNDGAAMVCARDGISLVYTGRDEDGLTITMTFARPEDVLSGEWAISRSPEEFDLEHEGIAGDWRCVAWLNSSLEEAQAAHSSALMLDAAGLSFQLSIADDGSFAMMASDGSDAHDDPTEGALTETEPGTYECGVDSDILNFTLADGRINLHMGEGTLVFAPLAETA